MGEEREEVRRGGSGSFYQGKIHKINVRRKLEGGERNRMNKRA